MGTAPGGGRFGLPGSHRPAGSNASNALRIALRRFPGSVLHYPNVRQAGSLSKTYDRLAACRKANKPRRGKSRAAGWHPVRAERVRLAERNGSGWRNASRPAGRASMIGLAGPSGDPARWSPPSVAEAGERSPSSGGSRARKELPGDHPVVGRVEWRRGAGPRPRRSPSRRLRRRPRWSSGSRILIPTSFNCARRRRCGSSRPGRAVIDRVSEAVAKGPLEVVIRGVHVLRELALSGDDDVQELARAALERIASVQLTAAARRAEVTIASLNETRQTRAMEELQRLGPGSACPTCSSASRWWRVRDAAGDRDRVAGDGQGSEPAQVAQRHPAEARVHGPERRRTSGRA